MFANERTKAGMLREWPVYPPYKKPNKPSDWRTQLALVMPYLTNEWQDVHEISDQAGVNFRTAAYWLAAGYEHQIIQGAYVNEKSRLKPYYRLLGSGDDLPNPAAGYFVTTTKPRHTHTRPSTPAPPKSELEHLYLEEKLSIDNIGRRYKISGGVVKKWLISAEIPIRMSPRQIWGKQKESL